jgi:hypothetical protein
VKKIIENHSVSLRRLGHDGFRSRPIYSNQWHIVRTALFVTLFASFGFAQDRPALTLNQISDLLKNGVSSTRIAQLVEQRGVGFELNEAAVRQLKAGGADELVLSTVKKIAARYTDEQQRRKRSEEVGRPKSAEEGTREEEITSRMEEVRKRLQEKTRRSEEEKNIAKDQKPQQPMAEKGTQEASRKVEESKRRVQEEARQKPQKGTGATLLSQEDVGQVASLRNVMSSEGGEVSGEVVNNSKQTLRDLQLQIIYSWRWKDEYHPGKDDPGMALYHVLNREIPSGQTARFDYKPSPPLASREDGQFDTSVKVVGFAQVFPQGAQR